MALAASHWILSGARASVAHCTLAAWKSSWAWTESLATWAAARTALAPVAGVGSPARSVPASAPSSASATALAASASSAAARAVLASVSARASGAMASVRSSRRARARARSSPAASSSVWVVAYHLSAAVWAWVAAVKGATVAAAAASAWPLTDKFQVTFSAVLSASVPTWFRSAVKAARAQTEYQRLTWAVALAVILSE